jgi:hypothetical protein
MDQGVTRQISVKWNDCADGYPIKFTYQSMDRYYGYLTEAITHNIRYSCAP